MTVRNVRARVSWAFDDLAGPSLPGAACARMAPMFDGHIDKEPAPVRERRQQEARKVCRGCPVRAGCLARRFELERRHEPPEGVWAGEVLVPVACGQPCRVCGSPVPRARRRCATCSEECSALSRTRRAHTETCLVCDAPIPDVRLKTGAVTCTTRCSRAREQDRLTQIREERVAAEVAWVLANGAPDIGAPARARLVVHWTAEGWGPGWIADRLQLSVRQVHRILTRKVPT